MIKVFVLTDNPKQYFRIRSFLSKKKKFSVNYFCSPSSVSLFSSELSSGAMFTINLRSQCSNLLGYDVGFSVHSKQIFPRELVESVRCVNVHPGYNPENRGWYPQVFSLLAGEDGGATVHLMDAEIDHGPVLVQEKVHALPTDTSKDLYERVLDCEYRLFSENFDELVSFDVRGHIVESEGNYNSIQDFRDLCKIDLEESVTFRQAINKLRALSHPPYRNAFFIDENGSRIYLELRLQSDTNQTDEV